MAKSQKLNLIEELTTHKCDYQVPHLDPSQPKADVRQRYEPEPKPPPPYLAIDSQSHAVYRQGAHVPFDLYVGRKPIVRTDPRECFKLDKGTKAQRGTAVNRVTTNLSPCLPLAEIDDERDLDTVLGFTYSQVQNSYMKEAAMDISQKPSPPHRVVADSSCNVTFKAQLYPPLPPGWLGAAGHWDSLQSRSLGDPFKSFWTRRGPDIECSCCCNPLPTMLSKETKDQISQLILDDNLRLPYDITKTGYRGYRQICAKGVPLAKKQSQLTQ